MNCVILCRTSLNNGCDLAWAIGLHLFGGGGNIVTTWYCANNGAQRGGGGIWRTAAEEAGVTMKNFFC